jgi:hypothetical protein
LQCADATHTQGRHSLRPLVCATSEAENPYYRRALSMCSRQAYPEENIASAGKSL